MCHNLILFLKFPSVKKRYRSVMEKPGSCFPPSASENHANLRFAKDIDLNLDVAHLDSGEILPVPALNLVLVGSLVFQHRQLLGPPLLDNLPGYRSFLSVGANEDLFVAVDREYATKIDLFPHFACYPLNANDVAGRDTILFAPGLDDGVHLSSQCL
jgi:hypothetical protein